MKKISLFIVFPLVLGLMSFAKKSDTTPEPVVIVHVNNVKYHVGNVKAILYNRDNFLTDKFISCIEIPIQDPSVQSVEMVFHNLPTGWYAIAIYHDLNNNDHLDRNWIGYPKEPYAISNNLRPFNLLMPSFDKAKFQFDNQPITLTIDLLNN